MGCLDCENRIVYQTMKGRSVAKCIFLQQNILIGIYNCSHYKKKEGD